MTDFKASQKTCIFSGETAVQGHCVAALKTAPLLEHISQMLTLHDVSYHAE